MVVTFVSFSVLSGFAHALSPFSCLKPVILTSPSFFPPRSPTLDPSTTLVMDACMTIHKPHINEFFTNIPEVEGHILALPDPWMWGKDMLRGRLLSCTNQTLLNEMEDLMKTKLRHAIYFTTGLILYDTSIIRNYDGHSRSILHINAADAGRDTPSTPTPIPTSSMIDILELYHRFGSQFPGDQPIVSIYWYHVRDLMRNLPLSMLGTNRVPYEFLKRIPKSPHIVTAGNNDRPRCLLRRTNVFGVDPKFIV